MKQVCLLAALLCASTAPALADWDNIGSVDVSYGRDNDSPSFNLGGPVERLQLTADRGDVVCRSVRADFGNGQAADIFHGPLPQGRAVSVDLPGNARTLRGLTFKCGAQNPRGAVIRIAADVGRYRDEWRRNPNWQGTWSRMFHWDNAPANNGGGMGYGGRPNMGNANPDNNWQMIGSESFEGRNDHENSFAGWQGRQVSAVALKPLEADVRCSSVMAHFGDGRSQPLNVNNGDVLHQGRFYKLDLPGNLRNLDRLALRCSPVNAPQVTMQIFVNK